MLSIDQGERRGANPHARRRRGHPAPRFPGACLARPGRFFKRDKRLHAIRLAFGAFHLGEADWLLYRRRACPFGARTWNHRNYLRGFAASKAAVPRPAWPAINW